MEFLGEIRKKLEELEKYREELIRLTRELRISSTKAIAEVHAGKLEKAEEKLKAAVRVLEDVKKYRKFPEIYYAISREAMQEFVEACTFFSLVSERRIPDFRESGVEDVAILTGLADAVGELRRYALDLMRKGEVGRAERCIEDMEDLYNQLITFIFPEKLVPGLRHKVDIARQLIERTKSDLLAAELINRLG